MLQGHPCGISKELPGSGSKVACIYRSGFACISLIHICLQLIIDHVLQELRIYWDYRHVRRPCTAKMSRTPSATSSIQGLQMTPDDSRILKQPAESWHTCQVPMALQSFRTSLAQPQRSKRGAWVASFLSDRLKYCDTWSVSSHGHPPGNSIFRHRKLFFCETRLLT